MREEMRVNMRMGVIEDKAIYFYKKGEGIQNKGKSLKRDVCAERCQRKERKIMGEGDMMKKRGEGR